MAPQVPRPRTEARTRARRASACSWPSSPPSPVTRQRAAPRWERFATLSSARPRCRSPIATGCTRASSASPWRRRRVSAWLDEPELEAGARALVADAALPDGPRRCPDVIMGSAGAIVGLARGSPRPSTTAVSCGVPSWRATSSSAEPRSRRHGWSWAIPGRRSPHHVCGLAHGAGGIGWALLELFAATGDERFRDGAAGAFAYERSWLDAASGTWPDLRIPGLRRGRPQPDGVADDRHVVPWRSRHRADAAARGRLPGSDAERRDAELRARDDPPPRRRSAARRRSRISRCATAPPAPPTCC